ncbi:hypothetical protein NLG97_g8259 [Lecanicillium saksenae]|uniref:Uncharacterized protein n=1 Tax=Lecanicillium saksenae TaxID=468837 RepID=A0ACC1QKL9_9HYPO|nr:hypothetical protein NLG97_g8259 [Lecanicillium saksenae]
MARVKTRILIISDTHAHIPALARAEDELTLASDFKIATTGFRAPLPEADVVLHCGDLTTGSAPYEYQRTINMLRALRAPLKIVIPGNHDRCLDEAFWCRKPSRGELYAGTHDPDHRTEALEILQEAKADGVVYIGQEGVYSFPLRNGAVLKVFASPHTPEYGVWGFQYDPEKGHEFPIPAGIDVAMTHGPPRDVLDLAGFNLPQYGVEATRAGCPDLFTAVAKARPQIHCFGHIHEAWGAYRAHWKQKFDSTQKHIAAEEAIDKHTSRSVVALADTKPITPVDPPATEAQAAQLLEWSKQQGVHIDLEDGRKGEETLFINAAIQGFLEKPSHLPFVVDIMLDEAVDS